MKKSKELSNREEPSEVNATKEEEKEEENIKEIQMSTLKLVGFQQINWLSVMF